ncbi:hypothetical protein BH23ACT8_BH23ACT8_04400 [soil metagenome]
MGGRAAQVVMGVAILFLAGVLIRPPEAAFTRPLPRPTGPPVAAGEPTPTATPTATPTPRARRVRARNPEPKPEPVLVVHAIDPDTLADRVPPLEVPGGPGWVQAVVSDDGAILALARHGEQGTSAEVTSYRTDDLHPLGAEVTVPGGDAWQVTSAGDVTWIGGHGGARTKMHRLRAGESEVSTAELPAGFNVWEFRALDERRVAMFGSVTADASEGEVPAVALVDGTSLVGPVSLALPPMWRWEGDPGPERAQGDIPVAEQHTPGVAWDPAAERLYVAHAHEDRVTVIDLRDLSVAQELAAAPGLLAGMRDWLLPAAHAGGGYTEGEHRTARLDPRSSRLVVSGERSFLDPPAGDATVEQRWEQLPTIVFDVESGGAVHQLAPDLGQVAAVRDDGTMAFVKSWYEQRPDSAVRIAGPDGQVVSQIKVSHDVQVGFTPSGRLQVAPYSPGSEVTVRDPATGVQVASRGFEGQLTAFPGAGIVTGWIDPRN